jgi:hypothetical protein
VVGGGRNPESNPTAHPPRVFVNWLRSKADAVQISMSHPEV